MRMVVITMAALIGATACGLSRSRIDVTPAGSAASSQAASSTTADNGFEYRRLHSAAGQFITRDALLAAGDVPLSIVLRSRLLGFTVSAPSAPGRENQSRCLDVFLNGLRILELIDTIRPSELSGVEYYQASSAPVAYRRAFSTCPTLLLWLR